MLYVEKIKLIKEEFSKKIKETTMKLKGITEMGAKIIFF